ncbi:SHOCT domain-containing protein [Streptomyces sp. NPDC050264]|uniref:SHOCT domain-containing protein n=1 Tax=Streptomyces sp. NPDC050264 TaxID=3155038 RepID=UPI003438A7D2
MRTSARKRADRRRAAPTGISLGHGVAVLLARRASWRPECRPPKPMRICRRVAAGSETDTPSLVTGPHDEVPAGGSATEAARGHLAEKKGRYQLARLADLRRSGSLTDEEFDKAKTRLLA